MTLDDDEVEWRSVIRFNYEVPGYLVSTEGEIIGKRGTRLKLTHSSTDYLKFDPLIPKDWGGETTKFFVYRAPGGNSKLRNYTSTRLTIQVHRAVLETFRPIDDYPPIPKEDWDVCPESAKQFIRDSAFVDHIDGNKLNNSVNNLRWVTPRQNCIYHKEKEFLDDNNLDNSISPPANSVLAFN
jgi:hypothetical protein